MLSKLKIDKNGTKSWHNEKGQLHREDGPAIEAWDGTKHWMINGLHHRIGGPAFEYYNGDKSWYLNGKLHRLDGPAIERSDGDNSYYFMGERINSSSQKEFERMIQLLHFK